MMSYEVVNNQIKKSREEILAELQKSVAQNNAIGIIMKDTRELITTSVVNIEWVEGNESITLQDQDLHGFPLERNRISINDIQLVIHFDIPFDDPQYVNVRRKEKLKV